MNWRTPTRAQIVLCLVWFLLMIAGATTRETPDVSVWFSLTGLGVVIAILVISFQRWNHGRVPRDQPKD